MNKRKENDESHKRWFKASLWCFRPVLKDVWALFDAWWCRSLKMQQGATADTETLQPADSNPFWISPGTNVGPYVWQSSNTLLQYATRERDENILPATLAPAIRSVIKSSCEHRWEKGGRKKKNNTPNQNGTQTLIAQSAPLFLGEEGKVNYIKQTYVILIPLKLWITALINHSLIWALNLYVLHLREISLFLSHKRLWLFLSSPWAIFHCMRIATQLSLCQTIISGFNLIFITPQSYFNYTCYHSVDTYCI